MTSASVNFGQSLLFLLAFCILMAWTWALFMCFADLIREPHMAGWRKALWVLVLLLPVLGCLIYLAVRGSGMEPRAIWSQRELWK